MKKIIIFLSLLILVACTQKQYEIINEKNSETICKLQVKTIGEVSKRDLLSIAKELREEKREFKKVLISFYKPEQLPDSTGRGYYAYANYLPEFEFEVIEDRIETVSFPKYVDIEDMLKAANDFNVEDGTLKIISKENNSVHVQVSKKIFAGETDEIIIEQTKRDIVYVAFQTFAQTNLNSITVTSIPINEYGEYSNKYKLKLTVTRDKALKVIKKFLENDSFHNLSFQDLYQLTGTLYLPNSMFSKLKFDKLNEVYSELAGRKAQ